MGATGNVGSKVANNLLNRRESSEKLSRLAGEEFDRIVPADNIRVLSRSMDNLRHFKDRGAEAFVGDAADPAFLTKAFTGVDAVFTLIPSDLKAADFNAYQNRIGESIAQAIKNSGVKYVVNLSSIGADLPGGNGPIKALHDQEQRLNNIENVNVIHLRPAHYMENLLMSIDTISSKGVVGDAVRADLKMAMIATKDVAKAAADCLVERNFSGKTVKDLLGQRDLTMEEAAKAIGGKIGKPALRYATLSYDEAYKEWVAAGLSPDACRLFVEMCKGLNDGLFGSGKVGRTTPNTTETSIEEFADFFAKAYRSTISKKAA
jgi:uncharacterized protein YbjT (DUF2867 family)